MPHLLVVEQRAFLELLAFVIHVQGELLHGREHGGRVVGQVGVPGDLFVVYLSRLEWGELVAALVWNWTYLDFHDVKSKLGWKDR